MKRRHFIAQSALAGFAGALNPPLLAAGAAADTRNAPVPPAPAGVGQTFHRDYVSYREGLEYFLLGNGLIQVALQTAATPEVGTHAGLFVMSPEHFCRKASTFLYHPERGVENTRLFVNVNGRDHVAAAATSRVAWIFPDGVPTIRLEWRAGDVAVVEEFTTPPGVATLLRTVTLTPTGTAAAVVSARALLYPNLMLFDEYVVDREKLALTAHGFCTLSLRSPEATSAGDRHLNFAVGSLAPGATRQFALMLSLDDGPGRPAPARVADLAHISAAYWQRAATIETGDPTLAHLFRVSVAGLRTAVATSGKMDGSIWQYNLEWVRDQSMVAAAAAMVGLTDRAANDPAPRLLERILARSIDANGGTVDSSRTRPAELAELDQNGELLHALWTHWVWTGDTELIRRNLPKLVKIGEYLQRPEFVDPDSGLLHNSREYWERDPHFGVRDGFENTYQLWTIVCFDALADMVEVVGGDAATAGRWREAARKLQTAFLSHPRHALVADGTLIKRRLPDGSVQRLLVPPNRASLPPGMPLSTEPENLCDPDAGSVLPIVHGVVDPRGPVAQATLDAMETLWNQRWSGGGYGRYHVTSESDSPGPWPFASLFVARANLLAGRHDRVWRTLRWLAEVPGGRGGAWWEFYGARPTPPLPPVGLVVWTWAEIVMFFTRELVGVRPQPRELLLAPHLLAGLATLRARLTIRGVRCDIILRRTAGAPRAVAAGREFSSSDGVFRLPYPTTAATIECFVR